MNITRVYILFYLVNVILLKAINIHEGYFKGGVFSSMVATYLNKSNVIFVNHQINDGTTLKTKPKKYHNHIYFGLSHVKDNHVLAFDHDIYYLEYFYPELAFRKYFSGNRYFFGINFDMRYILFNDIFDFFTDYYSFVEPLRLDFGVRINKEKNIYFYMESATHSILELDFPPLGMPVFYLTFLKSTKKNINYSLNFGMFIWPRNVKESILFNTRYKSEWLMYGYSIKFLIGFL
jgi:hypothetical protein